MNQEQFELLSVEPRNSPRMEWIIYHCVSTRHFSVEEGYKNDWAAWSGNVEVNDDSNTVFGTSEHDAIVNLALRHGWKLWNEDKA
jgi:hypothetical protein